jgi:flagellar M-ring protein FliF
MAGFVEQLRENTGQFFQRLSFQKKLMVIVSFILLFTILIVLFVWSNKPDYVTLFSNLNDKDAGEIIQKLQDKKISYKISPTGNTILVPASVARELRLELARDGLPGSSVVGYELFDRSNLGMTDFVQKLNYRRALEGELSKTIQEIDVVEKARVHIVIPEKSLFTEDQKPTTASVVLKLKGHRVLSESNVQAIIHLVSASVEGLLPENVTIVDTRGRILSNQNTGDNLIAMSSTQMELIQKVEKYLSGKAQSMLDNVLGPENAIVRVNADLDFAKVEQTIEQYDPDNTVVRSEEIDETETPNAITQNGNSTQTSAVSRTSTTVTNYEISKTFKHIMNEVGSIKKLSIAVIVNKKPEMIEKNGKKELIFKDRTPQEIKTIAELVKNAVGFDPNRGDKISVQSIAFTNENLEEPGGLFFTPTNIMTQIGDYLKYIVVVAIIILSIMIIRSIMNIVTIKPDILPEPLRELELEYAKSKGSLPSGEKGLVRTGGAGTNVEKKFDVKDFEEELSEEVLARSEFRAKIRDYVSEKPEEAVKLLRVWLHEEEED